MTEIVEVTQADRDAAGAYLKSKGYAFPSKAVLENPDLVQAFARHRAEAATLIETQQAMVGERTEMLRRALAYLPSTLGITQEIRSLLERTPL